VEDYDCARALDELEVAYGADLLMRSAVWLTIKESRASFAIEHEEKQVDRIRRFAAVMAERCGKGGDPLDAGEMTDLQTAILGRATRYGLRKSPVFVGHTSGYAEIVDYVAPHWEQTGALLEGLQAFLSRTQGRSPILRAAVASFGFVYIHPMADGNGRISRFLVNDVLRRDGAVPAPFILPISAAITNTTRARAGYDHALEALSKPLLAAYREHYAFGPEVRYEDGIVSNFHFDAYDAALHVWKYPDLTAHAEYMGQLIQMTIRDEMNREALYLRNLDRAREGVKNWLEGPNTDIDRIIRSISQGGAWKVSNKLAEEFPLLAGVEVAQNVVKAIRDVFSDGGSEGAGGESGPP
jgi:Fic/DOC family